MTEKRPCASHDVVDCVECAVAKKRPPVRIVGLTVQLLAGGDVTVPREDLEQLLEMYRRAAGARVLLRDYLAEQFVADRRFAEELLRYLEGDRG